jgi:hypothetical protein
VYLKKQVVRLLPSHAPPVAIYISLLSKINSSILDSVKGEEGWVRRIFRQDFFTLTSVKITKFCILQLRKHIRQILWNNLPVVLFVHVHQHLSHARAAVSVAVVSSHFQRFLSTFSNTSLEFSSALQALPHPKGSIVVLLFVFPFSHLAYSSPGHVA